VDEASVSKVGKAKVDAADKGKTFTELKRWGDRCTVEGWTGKLVGLAWKGGAVEETRHWAPPQGVGKDEDKAGGNARDGAKDEGDAGGNTKGGAKDKGGGKDKGDAGGNTKGGAKDKGGGKDKVLQVINELNGSANMLQLDEIVDTNQVKALITRAKGVVSTVSDLGIVQQ
ncbi:unnamed protein product, partial [Prorocentrum cordatum]